MTDNFKRLRNLMVEEQLKTRHIKSEAVLDAMRNVPRHLFVQESAAEARQGRGSPPEPAAEVRMGRGSPPEDLQRYAYEDSPLPIGFGQTISQPYIVAFMTEMIEPFPGMKILEIGTGSGYQAAVLAYLGCEVFTVELLEELAVRAKNTLAALGFENVKVKHGNAYSGWPEEAPFDTVIVTAAPDKIPEKLIEQLKDGGRMIIPVGNVNSVQSLKLVIKKEKRIIDTDLLPVRFVPMVE